MPSTLEGGKSPSATWRIGDDDETDGSGSDPAGSDAPLDSKADCLARGWCEKREMWHLCADRAVRGPFLCLVVVWVSLSFGYYGLATWITVLFKEIGLANVYSSVSGLNEIKRRAHMMSRTRAP